MNRTTDLRPFLLKRSLAALREFSFTCSEDQSRVIVSAKACVGFAPKSLESAAVRITLMVAGVMHQIRGRLTLVPPEHARGVWYPYEFVPDGPRVLSLFRWDSPWSNVKEIKLHTSQGAYRYENLFFRE